MHGTYPMGVNGLGGLGELAGLGSIGSTPFLYIPDLAPVGSGSAYFPRDVEQDAAALHFLGFLADNSALSADRAPSTGSQAGDMNAEAGAWDPEFRGAVTRFQAAKGLTTDSWIGPHTRTAIAAAVTVANANGLGGGVVPALPPAVIPVNPGGVPVAPNAKPLPGIQPAGGLGASGDETMTYVAIGAAVLAVAAIGWWALSK